MFEFLLMFRSMFNTRKHSLMSVNVQMQICCQLQSNTNDALQRVRGGNPFTPDEQLQRLTAANESLVSMMHAWGYSIPLQGPPGTSHRFLHSTLVHKYTALFMSICAHLFSYSMPHCLVLLQHPLAHTCHRWILHRRPTRRCIRLHSMSHPWILRPCRTLQWVRHFSLSRPCRTSRWVWPRRCRSRRSVHRRQVLSYNPLYACLFVRVHNLFVLTNT